MEPKEPTSLTTVKVEEQGLGYAIVYAADPDGNVWRTRQVDGVPGEWRLYKKASEIVWPTLSYEQMLELGRKRQEQADNG